MRCPKCGYVSFDYLSSCRKCSKDLTEVQQSLNLFNFKPEVPFLLGSLVGGDHLGGSGGQATLSLTQETELELAGLEASGAGTLEETMDMQSLQGTVDMEGLETSEDVAPLTTTRREVSLEELSEASDEGLESTLEGDDFLGLEIDRDRGWPSATPDAVQDFEPQLDTDAIDLFDDTARRGLETEELSQDIQTGDRLTTPEPELDLSEADLSDLAKELEDQLQADRRFKEAGGEEPSSDELEAAMLEMEKERDS